MRRDEDYTDPFIPQLDDDRQLAKGSRTFPRTMAPAFISGDWLVSPSGVEGYIAGRSSETEGAWLFVIKTGESMWDSTIVEMMPEHFAGFRMKERIQ
jgi:hypothetical protein